MSNVRVAVGKKPGWEISKGGHTVVDGEKLDVEMTDGEEKELKSISELGPLTISAPMQRWLFNPPFTKFSSRARGKEKVEIPQPPHSLTFLGRCDVEIGPHIFLETKIIEVNYDQVHTGPLNPLGSTILRASTATDVLLEFRENPTERFLLPLDCSIIERVLRLGVPPTILLSTAVPAIAPEKMISGAPAQHPFTIRFVHAGTPLWEAMQKRVISSKMPIQTVQHLLQQAVNSSVPRAFIPHRLPAGPDLDRIAQAMADPFEAKPMVLKELHETPVVSEVPKKRKAVQQSSSQSTTKPPPPKYVTSSGREITAMVRESPEAGDPSSSKRKTERRVKVSCSVCGKSINRKAEDVGRDTFKPLCRDCASDARRVRDAARVAAAPPSAGPRQAPRMTVEVVLPQSRPGLPYMPRPTGTLQWPNGGPGGPSPFNLFSPRPPPAPPHLTTYTPYTTTPVPGALMTSSTASASTLSAPTSSSIPNPYAYPYRPPPAGGPNSPAPPGPPAHPYTGRYYGAATADGHAWRPPLYAAPPYNMSPTARNSVTSGASLSPNTQSPLPPAPRVPPTPAGVKPLQIPTGTSTPVRSASGTPVAVGPSSTSTPTTSSQKGSTQKQ